MAKNIIKRLQEKGADIQALVLMLNKAYADELLAWAQYSAPIGLCIGKLRPDVEAEFKKHAEEELKHAEMLRQRIIELDGVPLQSPQEWFSYTNCGYDKSVNFNTKALVEQNIKAEICAQNVYLGIMKACKEIDDFVTYRIARNILIDEEEHEQDLEDFIDDMEII